MGVFCDQVNLWENLTFIMKTTKLHKNLISSPSITKYLAYPE